MAYQLTTKHPKKRAFITGGGGSLGRAFAIKLARDGWTIGITDIMEAALNESKELILAAGGQALTYRFDVSDKVQYQQAFDDFIVHTGGIDLLINNAGVGDGGLFGEYDLAHWDWITGINQMAAVYGSHFAVPHMKKQQSGHVISIASAAGFANMPNMSMYNVTKAAVISLMETLYAELFPFHVQCSVVCPTFFRSNIMQHNRGDKEATGIGQHIINKARFGPDDIAEYVLTQAGKGEFYILHPYQAKWVFNLKRLMPRYFLKIKARRFAKKDWVQEALRMKF